MTRQFGFDAKETSKQKQVRKRKFYIRWNCLFKKSLLICTASSVPLFFEAKAASVRTVVSGKACVELSVGLFLVEPLGPVIELREEFTLRSGVA